MKKKKIFTLIMCLLPILLIVIGFSTWIIIHEFSVAPKFDPNSVFYTHLHNQEVTYNGQGQLPYNEKIDLDSGYIKYKYRKVGQATNQYLEDGMPSNAGEYYIYFYDTRDENRYEPSDVKFTIKKADLVKKQDVSVNYNQGSNNGYFTTSMDVSSISYGGGEFVDPTDNNLIISGTASYSDETNTSLKVGTHSYQYAFSASPILDEWNENVVNYNDYIGTCNIITKATVSFTNDGSQYGNTLHVAYGDTITQPTSPSKTGYDFDGWYFDSSKWNFTSGVTSDMNLVATYTPIKYSITYLDNDGSTLTTTNPTTYTIEDEITLTDPAKDGYAFLGWTGTGLEERTRTVKINRGSTGDRTYTAHWKIGIKINSLDIDYTSRKQWTVFQSNDIPNAISTYLAANYPNITLSNSVDYTINYMTDDNYIEEATSSGKIYNSSTLAKVVNGSTYIVNITMKNEEYALYDQVSKSYLETANVLLKYKTVYLGFGTSTLYTIEDAIESAGTSTIITAGANTVVSNGVTTSTFIRTNFTALSKEITGYTDENYKLKTKLRVPFAAVDMDLHGSDGRVNSGKDGFETTAVTAIKEVYSILYIPNNVTINIESGGDLVVGGLLGSSGTTKNRGVIYNNGSIEAKSGANIHSYGYIKGTGIINLNNGSILTDVCAIFDWMGGSKSGGLNNAKIFPINAFTIHNNSCTTKINAGSNYEAFWNIEFANTLYTGFQRGDNNGNIIIVGDNGLFKISSGYIIKEADEGVKNSTSKNLITFTGSNQTKGQRDIVRVFGTCTDNSISVKIDASLTSFNMTTNTTMALPIAYMKISTEDDNNGNVGNLTIQASSYKFLPGSSLTIHKNTTVNVNSGVNMLFYDINACILDEANRGTSFITESGGQCIDRIDAYVEVNGTFNVKSGAGIGGKILTNSIDAETIINGSATCGVLYTTSYSDGAIMDSYTTKTRTYNAKMRLFNGTIIQSNLSTIAPGEYFSIGANNEYGWRSNKLSIYYDLNGGYLEEGQTLPSTKEKTNVGTSGYTIVSDDLPSVIPKKEHYTFKGWYLDVAGNSIADGTNVFASVYIFAAWTPIEYNITYEYIYSNCNNTGESNISNSNPNKYNVDQTINLKIPTSKDNYVFGGWYMDETLTTPINKVSGSNYGGDISVYGLWYPAGTKTYEITYVTNNDKFSLDKDFVVSTNLSAYILPELDDYNNDTTYDRYLAGWYIDAEFSTPFNINNISSNLTIYAKWEYKVNINMYYYSSDEVQKTKPALNTISFSKDENSSGFYMPNISITIPDLAHSIITGYSYSGLDSDYIGDSNTYQIGSQYIVPNSNIEVLDSNNYLTINIKPVYTALDVITVTIKNTNRLSGGQANLFLYRDDLKEYYTQNDVSIERNNSATFDIYKGYSFEIEIKTSGAYISKDSDFTKNSSGYYVVESAGTIEVSGRCFTEGTLITLANGNKKPVEQLNQGDMLLVFNHETGKLDYSPTSFVIHNNDVYSEYIVLNMFFDNGSSINIVDYHGFYDKTLNKYVYICEENIVDYIGHEFFVEDGTTTKLVDYSITEEYTRIFSPISYYHLNVFANGILTVTNFSEVATNIFEYDENMKYDEEKMMKDIETYGLFTYEDFKEYTSEEIYNAFPAQYFKVAIGKGKGTYEDIIWILNTFLQ